MGLKTAGILLGRSLGWNVEGLFEYLGVAYAPEDDPDCRRRVTLAEIAHRFDGGAAIAFYRGWTLVFSEGFALDYHLEQDPRIRELAPRALVFHYETYGDSYLYSFITRDRPTRMRRYIEDRWETEVGEPLPFDDPGQHGETAVDAAIEHALGAPVDAILRDPRLYATAYQEGF